MKICPYCKEEIKEEAIKCRFCQEFLDSSEKNTKQHNNEPKGIGGWLLFFVVSKILMLIIEIFVVITFDPNLLRIGGFEEWDISTLKWLMIIDIPFSICFLLMVFNRKSAINSLLKIWTWLLGITNWTILRSYDVDGGEIIIDTFFTVAPNIILLFYASYSKRWKNTFGTNYLAGNIFDSGLYSEFRTLKEHNVFKGKRRKLNAQWKKNSNNEEGKVLIEKMKNTILQYNQSEKEKLDKEIFKQ